MKKILSAILTLGLVLSPVSIVFQDTVTTVEAKSYKSGGFFSGGGLMRGLMVGGLAGLLFGSLFANMGAFGSILGLLINIIAIVVIFNLIKRLFTFYRNKKREEANNWRN